MRGSSLILALGALSAPVFAAPVGFTPYLFDWQNASGGRVRRVVLRCTREECIGKVLQDRDLLFSARLELVATTERFHRLHAELEHQPGTCRGKPPAGVSDPSIQRWEIRYFGAHLEGGYEVGTKPPCLLAERIAAEADSIFREVVQRGAKEAR